MTVQDVKELRERTGAGMMDCKAALEETGDMEKAIEWLRERGAAKAAKKAGRIAAEGLIGISIDGSNASIVEINSETDFVAKNPDFRAYVQDVANEALKANSNDLDAFMSQNWKDSEKSVSDALTEQVATIGEKITIRRLEKVNASNGMAVSYLHNGGKIGVIVNVETDNNSDAVKEIAQNVAMQAAAMNPMYLSKDDVDADYIAKEKEIIVAQIKEDPKMSSKPQNIIDGMVEGKMSKQLKEVCLLEQQYVKDGNMSVAKYVEEEAKKLGAKIAIKGFVRYEAGEGIEKREENFAEEVAKQMNQNN